MKNDSRANDIEVRVPVVSLQEMLQQQPTCIIADIQGAEIDLFDGHDMPSVRKVLLEIHPELIGQDGVQTVFDRLGDSGFEPDTILSKSRIACFRRADSADERASPATEKPSFVQNLSLP